MTDLFRPTTRGFQTCVIGALRFGCDVRDAAEVNRHGAAIAAQWVRVPDHERSPMVIAVLVVDAVYRDHWLPLRTSAVDWGWEERVRHVAERVIPQALALAAAEEEELSGTSLQLNAQPGGNLS